jgi:hypothetical protein
MGSQLCHTLSAALLESAELARRVLRTQNVLMAAKKKSTAKKRTTKKRSAKKRA